MVLGVPKMDAIKVVYKWCLNDKEAVARSDLGSFHFHYQVWGRILIAQIQMIPPTLGTSQAMLRQNSRIDRRAPIRGSVHAQGAQIAPK